MNKYEIAHKKIIEFGSKHDLPVNVINIIEEEFISEIDRYDASKRVVAESAIVYNAPDPEDEDDNGSVWIYFGKRDISFDLNGKCTGSGGWL